MKKLLIYGGIVVLIFVALFTVTTLKQTEQAKGNPFGKDKLHPGTVELIDDPNYQNVILPDELEDELTKGETLTVYFYSPTCSYCKETTPRLMPLAEEHDIEIVQYNLLEFRQGWDDYQIDHTPTLVHYVDGEEVGRVTGAAKNEEYVQFFETMIHQD